MRLGFHRAPAESRFGAFWLDETFVPRENVQLNLTLLPPSEEMLNRRGFAVVADRKVSTVHLPKRLPGQGR